MLWQVKLGYGGPLGGIEWGMAADNRFQLFVKNPETGVREMRYRFTFNDRATAHYSFGQCARCRTVYWHEG